MARYDDDDKGGIFPTRTGPSIGASKERGMLDNLGGSDSFRTQLWNQPDGSVTRLKTKNGMPEFITEPAKGGCSVQYIDKFFATPSSETYPSGYAPPGTALPKGPFSEWVSWMGKTVAPSAAPAPARAIGELAPKSELDPDPALGYTVPGSVTWFSNKITVNGYPVVVSWRGNNSRAGTYGTIGQTAISSWTTKPSSNTGFRLDADCYLGVTDFSKYVWLSDRIKIDVGVTVWSAALRKISGVTYLYVVHGSDIYRAKIRLFSGDGECLVLNRKLSEKPLVMTLLGTFGEGDLSQMPFFNQSGTKIVLFRSAKQISASPVPSPGWAIAEVDVDTFAVTTVFTNVCTQNTPTVTSYLTGTFPSNFSEGYTHSAYSSLDYKMAVAADYRADDLVYVTLHFSRTLSSYTVTYSATNDGAGVATFSMSVDSPITTDELIATHSMDGEVFRDTAPVSASAIRTFSGVQDIPGGVYNVNSSISATGTATTFEMLPFLVAADLRHDYTVFAYRKTITAVSGAGGWSDPGNVYAMLPATNTTYDSIYVAYVRDQELFRVSHSFGTASSTAMSASLGAPAPFTGISTPSPSTGSQTRYDGGPYSFMLGDTIGGTPTDVCAKVAHVTVSPDGKAAYVGLCWPTTDTESGVDEMYFTFLDAKGVRVTHKIPKATYAPGAASYLCGGIFYPRILEYP